MLNIQLILTIGLGLIIFWAFATDDDAPKKPTGPLTCKGCLEEFYSLGSYTEHLNNLKCPTKIIWN